MKNVDFFQYLTMSTANLRKLQHTKGWALSLIGLIVYGALRLFRQKPKDYESICPYFEIGNSQSGASFGWFFVCGKNCGDTTKYHEIGHSIQNAAVGGLKMLAYSIASVGRYWWRSIFESKTSYDDWFFEGQATQLGTAYVQNIEKDIKE